MKDAVRQQQLSRVVGTHAQYAIHPAETTEHIQQQQQVGKEEQNAVQCQHARQPARLTAKAGQRLFLLSVK